MLELKFFLSQGWALSRVALGNRVPWALSRVDLFLEISCLIEMVAGTASPRAKNAGEKKG